jgi:alcohol dehydrogenase
MKTLVFEEPGRLAWSDVEAPTLQHAREALVRPLAVARCDLDASILRGQAPFQGPFAIGHECVAEVIAIGDDVKSVSVGDRVVVPFQISCGACARCKSGLTASCTGVRARSMYGFGDLGGREWGGVLSDVVRVPFADAMLLLAPENVSSESLASAGDNVSDGYRTVAEPLARNPHAPVLVVGGSASSVGLYAVACARALGSSDVRYVDHDGQRLTVAERLGAKAIDTKYASFRGSFPITVDASAAHDGLAAAMLSTEPGGICTSVGIYYDDRAPVPLLGAYGIGLTFITGRVNSRSVVPNVLRLLAKKNLDVASVTTRLASWDDAIDAMLDPSPKVIVTRT